MNYPTLAEKAKLSLFDAKKTYILYHQTTPEIKVWWEDVIAEAKKNRMLWNCLGRRFKIIQRIDDTALESIVAFNPQSTIGDHVKRVWYQSSEDDHWDNSKMRIKINGHDSLIGIAHPSHAERACRIMNKYMETPIMVENAKHTKVEPCIIPGECKISQPDEKGIHRWSTLQKVKLH